MKNKLNFLSFFLLSCGIVLGFAGCAAQDLNSVSGGLIGYTRTYETGSVTFNNTPSFKVELTEITQEKEFYVASGAPSVITAEEAAIINCSCYVEGKEYVVIYLDLEENQAIHYDWIFAKNGEMGSGILFEARTEDNLEGLTPFRVTFENAETPYLMLDSINGKSCVVDFTSFFG